MQAQWIRAVRVCSVPTFQLKVTSLSPRIIRAAVNSRFVQFCSFKCCESKVGLLSAPPSRRKRGRILPSRGRGGSTDVAASAHERT
jgi:hypothetical protein